MMSPRFTGILIASLACLAAFGLQGCAGQDAPVDASLESLMARPSVVALAGAGPVPRRATAALPAAMGGVASIRDSAYADGFRQDILLGGGADRRVRNSITVLARTAARGSLERAAPLTPPTEASIATELAAQFPTIAMRVVTRPAANAYGPYGLALGHGAGDSRCLYAWQWIDDRRALAASGMEGPLSVRVRLCRRGQTFDDMALAIDQLRVGQDAAPVDPPVFGAPDGVVAGPPAFGAEGGGSHSASPVIIGAGDLDAPLAERPKRVLSRGAHRFRPVRRPEPDVAARSQPLDDVAQRFRAPGIDPAVARVAETKLSGDLPPEAYAGPRTAGSFAPIKP